MGPGSWLAVVSSSVGAPVTAGTNLLLAAQCHAYHRRLRGRATARTRLWSGFFVAMSVATLAGALKHGLRHELGDVAFAGILWISNIAGGVSTWCAQLATIVSHAAGPRRRRLGWLATVQLVCFLAANVAFGPEMLLLIADTGLGLLPVIGVEARSAARGRGDGAWIAAGLSVSIGTAAVYLTRLSIDPWLNHIDIAHLLLGVSFLMIGRGAGSSGAAAGGLR